MIHLPALPGSPAWDGTPLAEITAGAVADALTLERAGFDAVLVQNSLDRPTRERIDHLAVAQMTAIATLVRTACTLSIGINIVKNDGPAAVAIAAAAGADFVRVKVLAGTVLSAEGILNGCGHETHKVRRDSGEHPAIWADIREPTSRPFPEAMLKAAVIDAIDFAAADGIIVTGTDTQETLELAKQVRQTHPDAPLMIGGRVDASSIAEALETADSVIIGSALKAVPGIRGRVDFDAAHAIAAAAGRTESQRDVSDAVA
jgi:membrane complex biogenesis BtpA family protein